MGRLTFYVVTFNVATKSPDYALNDLLQWDGRSKQHLPDFCFFGFQEIKALPQNILLDSVFDDPWTAALRDIISGYDYVKIRTVKMVGLLLNVFCKRKHVPFLKEMAISETRTGLLGLWGNKGAVSFSFKIHGSTICCVNSHFAAHEEYLKHRIDDYHSIVKSQHFGNNRRTILNHDYVFWFGDLNFRLDHSKLTSVEEIVDSIKSVATSQKTAITLSDIWAQDELSSVMLQSKVFQGFCESIPMFPPTYRYTVGSCHYDLKRRPAWTDRILYKTVDPLKKKKCVLDVQSYNHIDTIRLSDHRPVYGESSIQIDEEQCSNEQIIFQPIKKWLLETENEVNLRIKGYVPGVNDWIGIFHVNYTSLDDYLSYVYLPSEPVEESFDEYRRFDHTASACRVKFLPEIFSDGTKSVCLKFSETSVLNRGTYQLIYFSSINNSVLGISNSFVAIKRSLIEDTPHEFGW